MFHNDVRCFDGHNDILLKIWLRDDASPDCFIDGFEQAQIDWPKAQKGGLAGGLCAIFPPSLGAVADSDGIMPQLCQQEAMKATQGMAKLLKSIEEKAPDSFKICKTAADIRQAVADKKFAAVYHIEGAEAISENLNELYLLHQQGLRSIGPVWSRPNIFAFGVPFRFNASPDIGPGLTEAGKRLVHACDELGIMIDLSHMNEKGFWDIAKISTHPLVASHSNAHHLCPQSRNLTDQQLLAIRDSGGLVGINFGVKFLRADGERNEDTPLQTIIDHMRYIVDLIGIDHVGFGSDFDGTTLPADLADCAALPDLINAMKNAGFTWDEIQKIAFENWISHLERLWGE